MEISSVLAELWTDVFLSLHICYSNTSEFKPVECDQGMLIPTFKLKLGAKRVFIFLIPGVSRSPGFYNKPRL